MKKVVPLLMLVACSSFATIKNPNKAAQDLCAIEWQITDMASSTDTSIPDIVDGSIKDFKSMGYSFSDFSIDEQDFRKVSIQGAEGSREMVNGMKTYTYADAKDMLKERMMVPCLENVKALISPSK